MQEALDANVDQITSVRNSFVTIKVSKVGADCPERLCEWIVKPKQTYQTELVVHLYNFKMKESLFD